MLAVAVPDSTRVLPLRLAPAIVPAETALAVTFARQDQSVATQIAPHEGARRDGVSPSECSLSLHYPPGCRDRTRVLAVRLPTAKRGCRDRVHRHSIARQVARQDEVRHDHGCIGGQCHHRIARTGLQQQRVCRSPRSRTYSVVIFSPCRPQLTANNRIKCKRDSHRQTESRTKMRCVRFRWQPFRHQLVLQGDEPWLTCPFAFPALGHLRVPCKPGPHAASSVSFKGISLSFASWGTHHTCRPGTPFALSKPLTGFPGLPPHLPVVLSPLTQVRGDRNWTAGSGLHVAPEGSCIPARSASHCRALTAMAWAGKSAARTCSCCWSAYSTRRTQPRSMRQTPIRVDRLPDSAHHLP